MVDPATLIPHPGNPRVHQDQVLRDSVRRFGQYRAVVVNKRTGRLVAGHGTVAAFAAERPGEPIQVSYVDVDEETADRILLIDNRASDLADNDNRLLAELLASLPDLDHTGYTDEDRETLLRIIDATTPPDETGTNPVDEWWDMPEVPEIIDGAVPYRRIIVAFEDGQGVAQFIAATGLQISDKAKSVWFPGHDIPKLREFRVVGDDSRPGAGR